ncbi:hypothetical protein LSUE1_G001266, partial [Lachnellula suecica]
MAQASRPPSGQNLDHPPSLAPSRATAAPHNSSPAGLGALELVELTANPIIEGILGPNKDGRIRNAVPSKLKGKTDHTQGNFGVMHMGMSPVPKKHEAQSRDVAAERDAAARRTSENTESRAKAAQQQKYAPPKKRGLEATLSEATRNTNRGSPFARDEKRQSRPLAPDETKMEQARLLTLLRSINPVTVVDQICKAVAYFGGIPGAPPPEDGIFPESANTRETGALFIGWLAEIFPDVQKVRSPEVSKVDLKKKGRPSKGHKAEPSGGDAGMSGEPPNSRNGYGYGPAVSAPAWGLPTNLAAANPQAPSVPEGAMSAGVEQARQPEQQPSTPLKQQEEASNSAAMSASKRRRGRPKGSTNKKAAKGDGQPEENASSSNAGFDGQPQSVNGPLHQSPDTMGSTSNMAGQDQSNFHPAIINQPTTIKPTQALQYSDQSWQNDSNNNTMNQAPAAPQDELSPEERAVLEAFRNPNVGTANALPSPVVSIKGPSEPAPPAKRKRAPAKPKAKPANVINAANAGNSAAIPNSASTTNFPSTSTTTFPSSSTNVPSTSTTNYPVQNPQQLPQQIPQQAQESNSLSVMNNDAVMGIAKDTIQWPSADSTTPTAPPAKRQRQRKPKVTNISDPPSRNQTASVVSSATPPVPVSTIPDSTAGSSQQSIQQNMPASRPPAEGLEAHYERFVQQQQNGRSHTPTVPQQQQQQHVRQPSKPTSVPPRQTTPHVPQQMQHQKSQQGGQHNVQRDDQKMTQGTSSRSSTGYYNQRGQSSSTAYNQQYPSHQTSQLYGSHTASPQMSNSSYRTSSTHTIAQASPQFSQAENPYRTASPHTIAQPSPSFSQTDNQFRATNAHSIAQPTPSFSQPENTYRTPSTHSMTQ